MAFTTEQEEVLKLIAEVEITRAKMAIEDQKMGDEIRAEFSKIDSRIRAEHAPIANPLRLAARTAEENLRKRFE